MISIIRNSFLTKVFSLSMIWVMVFTIIAPLNSFGLTGGPAQPEFNSFTPIGTSDMVDLASGDFNYNIPIMDIGGFPINLAYSSGVTMDQEATWVGLGWNLSIGQINRQMRGLPDDFKGDKMTYENEMKDNKTIGVHFAYTPAIVGQVVNGVQQSDLPGNLTFGATMEHNSYTGARLKPSLGISHDVNGNISLGLNVESSPDGMSLSPSASFHNKKKSEMKFMEKFGLKIGTTFNSRQGLTNVNMSASHKGATGPKDKTKTSATGKSIGSSIGFLPTHHTPQLQSNIMSENITYNAALGSEVLGSENQGQFRAYTSLQYIPNHLNVTKTKAYGYDYNHLADTNNVKDFNREKDGSFGTNSTNLPLTNFTYDIYNIQGQGIGGMFRPYRSQISYVNDNYFTNFTYGESAGVELGVGNAAHYGMDIETTQGRSASGLWTESNGNEALESFTPEAVIPGTNVNRKYEEVYFHNVGDLALDDDYHTGNLSNYIDSKPMRLKLDGTDYDRKLLSKYEYKNGNNSSINQTSAKRSFRRKRNQTILKVQRKDIDLLDNGVSKTLLGFDKNPIGEDHHTAGFIVTRNDGARYIYGDALYNTKKTELSFSRLTAGMDVDCGNGLIQYIPGVDNNVKNYERTGSQFFNGVSTPAYAHTFLLTTLLSTDYSDNDGIDGPSDGDLGSYTKFTYSVPETYKWRIPYQENRANHNEGLKSDPEDDKASYVYGEKEIKYIQKIETKTHIAEFTIKPRYDSRGVKGEDGGLPDATDASSTMYLLENIKLYSKEEYGDGTGNPTPIKTAHFVYNYDLCQGIPNNDGGSANTYIESNDGGKLTLKKVYFTYRNSKMGKYSPYTFDYGDINNTNHTNNPDYNLKAYDIWGNYKPNTTELTNTVTGLIPVPEFNYVEQEEANIDDYVSAWSLRQIELPSGGEISVTYEADDYTHVQDKKAMRMFKVAGAGATASPGALSNLSDLLFTGGIENRYLYIELPNDDQDLEVWTDSQNPGSTEDYYDRYLSEIVDSYDGLIQFRFFLNMSRKGGKNNPTDLDATSFDYVNGYFKLIENVEGANYHQVFELNGIKYASIRMKLVEIKEGSPDMVNPISKAGWQFGRKYLSNYIYDHGGVDQTLETGAIIEAVFQIFQNLKEIFTGANGLLKGKKMARRFIPEKSWIRLMSPNGFKKGGGCRVNTVKMHDGWGRMTEKENNGPATNKNDNGSDINSTLSNRGQEYGQEYDYTMLDKDNNFVSSGVATYEPIGALDNPLIQPVFVAENRLLGPDEENYMETPFGESFFPSPKVTYSRVSVQNIEPIHPNDNTLSIKKHATGKVVTEFYTSRDYPTICDQTKLIIEEDGGDPADQIIQNILSINIKKHLTLSQGYVVHKNDMDGKMKRQLVYAQDHENPISGAAYLYDGFSLSGTITDDITSTNNGAINNRVKVLTPEGRLRTKTLGVETDIINDFRAMTTETTVRGANGNTASFIVGLPIIVPLILPKYSHHEDKLRMSTTTKVVNTFGIQREVIAFDAGATVYTKNILWDSETGEVILTKTVNEYGDDYFSFNYPAHWYYAGMGQASFNSGIEIEIEPTANNTYELIDTQNPINDILFEGDELLIQDGTDQKIVWVNTISSNPDVFTLIDNEGYEHVSSGITTVKVIRSGKRNLQNTSMGSVVLQKNPIDIINASNLPVPVFLYSGFLNYEYTTASNLKDNPKIINAGAVNFSDEWPGCKTSEEIAINPNVNPYAMNWKGIWRAQASYLYLSGRDQNVDELGWQDDHATNNSATEDRVDPRNDGFYTRFKPFYVCDGGNWSIDKTNWTTTSQVTQFSPYGFELENVDALGRYSSAQYGYNNMFPMAVSANSKYGQMGFDGFEDYSFPETNTGHFNFYNEIQNNTEAEVVNTKSHTGKHSIKVSSRSRLKKIQELKF